MSEPGYKECCKYRDIAIAELTDGTSVFYKLLFTVLGDPHMTDDRFQSVDEAKNFIDDLINSETPAGKAPIIYCETHGSKFTSGKIIILSLGGFDAVHSIFSCSKCNQEFNITTILN